MGPFANLHLLNHCENLGYNTQLINHKFLLKIFYIKIFYKHIFVIYTPMHVKCFFFSSENQTNNYLLKHFFSFVTSRHRLLHPLALMLGAPKHKPSTRTRGRGRRGLDVTAFFMTAFHMKTN